MNQVPESVNLLPGAGSPYILYPETDEAAKVALAMYASHIEAKDPATAEQLRLQFGLKPIPLAAPDEMLDELIEYIGKDFFHAGMIVTSNHIKKFVREVVRLMLVVQKKHDVKRLLDLDGQTFPPRQEVCNHSLETAFYTGQRLTHWICTKCDRKRPVDPPAQADNQEPRS